jgi:hypothetical protein
MRATPAAARQPPGEDGTGYPCRSRRIRESIRPLANRRLCRSFSNAVVIVLRCGFLANQVGPVTDLVQPR